MDDLQKKLSSELRLQVQWNILSLIRRARRSGTANQRSPRCARLAVVGNGKFTWSSLPKLRSTHLNIRLVRSFPKGIPNVAGLTLLNFWSDEREQQMANSMSDWASVSATPEKSDWRCLCSCLEEREGQAWGTSRWIDPPLEKQAGLPQTCLWKTPATLSHPPQEADLQPATVGRSCGAQGLRLPDFAGQKLPYLPSLTLLGCQKKEHQRLKSPRTACQFQILRRPWLCRNTKYAPKKILTLAPCSQFPAWLWILCMNCLRNAHTHSTRSVYNHQFRITSRSRYDCNQQSLIPEFISRVLTSNNHTPGETIHQKTVLVFLHEIFLHTKNAQPHGKRNFATLVREKSEGLGRHSGWNIKPTEEERETTQRKTDMNE